MMTTPARTKFRELMSGPRFILALGVWDPYTARVAEALGIQCVHIGGYQLGAHFVTSEPLLTLTELATTTRYVTSAVRIPVVVDAGAGFGEPLHVMRTVKELERAGAVCIHIEDQIYPKRVHYHKGIEHVVPREDMVAKIKAAVAARTDPNFVIMGRTDAMKTSGFAEGVERANLYLEAGAEMVMIFPNTVEEARRAPREIKGLLAYTNSEGNRFGRPLFSAQEFEDMGYKLSTYPTALLCPVTQELKRVITNLTTRGVSGLPQDKMIVWRKEVEDLIGLEEYYKIESNTVEH
ncbi:MAG: isocitrate lyase/PEP mutase family protein [Betaproteobacteria bacterium]|nr:isocitrate lyase/PEP mutase family protein [Betaproteobacteria bacterium]MBI3053578.1 isocitrate lyase/PEP mutase family protein [Betaproteobacteria bacterium]